MDCLENESVCSVKKENNLGYYRLHTIWRNDSFFINVISKDGAWRGEMTPSDVQTMSSQLELDPKTYLQECKTALTAHDGISGMTYAVENGSFIWKKIVDEDSGIKIKQGAILLKPVNFVETIQNFVTVALNCNKKLEKDFKELSQTKNQLEINRGELLQKLNELVLSKNVMEDDLYSKFLILLNAKKEKIAELRAQLNENIPSSQLSKTDSDNINLYEVDTDDDCDVELEKLQELKKFSKERRSPLLGESSKEKRIPENINKTADGNSSCTETKVPEKEKISLPSSKEELLGFFYGS